MSDLRGRYVRVGVCVDERVGDVSRGYGAARRTVVLLGGYEFDYGR